MKATAKAIAAAALGAALLFPGTVSPAHGAPRQDANRILARNEANKALVRRAMTDLFVRRDVSAVKRYFGSPYLQHNPTIGDGLPKVINALPADFKYEPGIIVADGQLVMIHGLYTGWGPKPLVTVDIFRVRNGKLVEHWDVMQENVPASQTKSGRPMFPITLERGAQDLLGATRALGERAGFVARSRRSRRP